VTVSSFPAPRLAVQEAIERLEATGQPFTFFADTRSGRGSLICHRNDGHCGLVVPARERD
jgi:Sigma 54 modulation/S30EA ribosomal protein C terminus